MTETATFLHKDGTMTPILKSVLDNDLYKFTMGQVVFNQYPSAEGEFRFINRGKTAFAPMLAELLKEQVKLAGSLKMTKEEFDWLSSIRFIKPTYAEWLYGYFQLDPEMVSISMNNGELEVVAKGPWRKVMFWEIAILSMISELYYTFACENVEIDWDRYRKDTWDKARKMDAAGLKVADFGTRRRFSRRSQNMVVDIFKHFPETFLGTCNPHFAHLHKVTPLGTYAHECMMAMQALHGVRGCNKAWLEAWVREYNGDLGTALTDTVTTDVFLRDFDLKQANLYTGVRHDSGDPFVFGEKIIRHYKSLRIDPTSKVIVFSDGLDVDKAIRLHQYFQGRIKVTAGIGTNLSNDMYDTAGNKIKPLNIVMKPTSFKFNDGWQNVVKLSDIPEKYTGDKKAIEHALYEIGTNNG